MIQNLSHERFSEGLHFGEGPRVRDGQLWCSDMHGQRVLRFDSTGRLETMLEVAGDPSGLGWLPNGDLLVVSMRDRRVLRWNGQETMEHADLSTLAPWHCNDMVVDGQGRAWVGNFGFDLFSDDEPSSTCVVRVDPDGTACVAAEDLFFPNGTVITPDGRTMIVAESAGRRLTAFDIAESGELGNRRIWAELESGAVPDGICLDEAGGVWVASPSTSECLRIVEGGTITHRVAFDRGAFACILDGNVLYTLTAQDASPEFCRANTTGCVERAQAPYPAAGWP